MNGVARKTSMGVAAVATAGVSALFAGGASANAAATCDVGTLIAPGVCELKFTSNGQFIPTTNMSKLEVLLVGAGGSGVPIPAGTTGYAAAGGGGEVKIVDFSTATAPITVTVPTPGVPGGATDGGSNVATVNNGSNGVSVSILDGAGAFGGDSGNGNAGSENFWSPINTTVYASGAGAGAVPANDADGGAGISPSSFAPVGSLFLSDATCYGGGGAVGVVGTPEIPGDPPIPAIPAIVGVATCGGGAPNGDSTALNAALANSGGGGGSLGSGVPGGPSTGASGIVVFRWVPILPATGGAPLGLLPAALVALIAGAGLAAMATSRRKRLAD